MKRKGTQGKKKGRKKREKKIGRYKIEGKGRGQKRISVETLNIKK